MSKSQKSAPAKRSKINYGFIFSSAAFIGSLLSTALALAVVWLLNRRFGVWLGIPYTIRVLLISILSGAAIAVGLSKIFVSPMMKLGDAMRQVAGGDFSAHLDCSSRIRDVREVYGSFNTMVKELGNTETLQTDFVSNVSHEFKTPINAIEGYASLLQDSQLTDEQKNNAPMQVILRRSDGAEFFVPITYTPEERARITKMIDVTLENYIPALDRGYVPAIATDPAFIEYNAYMNEQINKIIVGEVEVDEWDNILEGWYAAGGEEYVNDMRAYIASVNK